MTAKTSRDGLLDSVSNALKILKLYSNRQPVLRVGDIATHLDVSKSTASRLVKTLVSEDFLEKDQDSSGYRLGKALLTLGGIFVSAEETYSEIAPYLNDLVAETKENAHFAVLSGEEIIYLMKYIGPYYSNTKIQVGEINPPHATSTGKVLLAYSSSEVTESIVAKGLEAYTENTITNPYKFQKELENIRKQGYSVSVEEFTLGNISFAAPIFNMEGELIGAVGLAGPTSRIKDGQIDVMIRKVRQAAQYASEQLGWDG